MRNSLSLCLSHSHKYILSSFFLLSFSFLSLSFSLLFISSLPFCFYVCLCECKCPCVRMSSCCVECVAYNARTKDCDRERGRQKDRQTRLLVDEYPKMKASIVGIIFRPLASQDSGGLAGIVWNKVPRPFPCQMHGHSRDQ